VFVFLKAMRMFVCLNTLVILLISGLQYVNFVHVFSFIFFHLNMDVIVFYLSVWILWNLVVPRHYFNFHSFLFSLVLLGESTFWRCEI